jgi:hypothetical protein
VFLTIWLARYIPHKQDGYLIKFAGVSAAALFVGTVQGVLQVTPDNAAWLLSAHKFGEYIDPISHAHINLVTGMVVSLGAFLVYFSTRMGGAPLDRTTANRLFWILVPGSLVFYFAFLLIGLILGSATVGHGGLELPALVPFVSASSRFWLAQGGTLMLLGFWYYFYLVARNLRAREFVSVLREASPRAFWFVSAAALFVGTLQGMLQIVPATAQVLVLPQEVPNIHAQLNMIGGVVVALMGVVYLLLPELTGQRVPRRYERVNLYGVGFGIAAYYIVVLVTGLVRGTYLNQGMNDAQAAAQLGWVAPALMLATALPVFVGYCGFGAALWQVTRVYRSETIAQVRERLAQYSGPLPPRVEKMPLPFLLALELLAGVFGFPGLGWLYAGQAIVGIGLLVVGPAIAWALIPFLTSPFSDTVFQPYGITVLFVWLGASSVLSSVFLAGYVTVRRAMARANRAPLSPAVTAAARPTE